MGNCQAIDSASLVIQHPISGRVDKMYWPVTASQIMKMNPGQYVALLLTTTLYSSAAAADKNISVNNNKNTPIRITRIKLLRPADTLVLGHVYRLVTSQEVMEGLLEKREIRKNHEMEKTKQLKHESRHRSRNNKAVINSLVSKSRASWQPSLKSISEAGS